MHVNFKLVVAVTVLLLALICHSMATVQVSFTERDYSGSEAEGNVRVVVRKEGENTENITVNVIPLTYEDFEDMGFVLSDDLAANPRPVPARNDPADFISSSITVTFAPTVNGTNEEMARDITIVDDALNEAIEGFYVILQIVTTNGEDVEIVHNVSLVRINDDDSITIGFDRTSQTITENTTVAPQVLVVKEDGVQSEQILLVLVQLSIVRSATEGEDFEVGTTPFTLVFQPEDQQLAVPVMIIDDDIPEEEEEFSLMLSTPLGTPAYDTGITTTTFNIRDNDIVSVGFEESVYNVMEGDGDVEVCVAVLHPNDIDLFASAMISTNSDTASEGADFAPLDDVIDLSDDLKSVCFNILITDDEDDEGIESFTIQLSPDPGFTEHNVLLQPHSVIVNIHDNDAINECATGQHNCHLNAVCMDTDGGYECQCKTGYMGNGRTCIDINECAESRDNCHHHATCQNTLGSYICRCKPGFEGNGGRCEDINECTRSLDGCHRNAICINQSGRYTCMCKIGYAGDGFTCMQLILQDEENRKSKSKSKSWSGSKSKSKSKSKSWSGSKSKSKSKSQSWSGSKSKSKSKSKSQSRR